MLVNRTRGSLKNPERNIKHYTPEVEPVSTSITVHTIGTIEIISPINHISNQANHLSFNIERWSLNWGSFNDKQSSLCWQLPVEGLIYIYRYTYICLFIACTRIRNDLSAKTMIPLGIRNPQGFMDPNKECVCVYIHVIHVRMSLSECPFAIHCSSFIWNAIWYRFSREKIYFTHVLSLFYMQTKQM